ncbi:MAG: extracellular solute-binding protein [Ruminococcaceae bacterium]|nr:extracellular solute-binding protein [Oscillospiraceae bacterium]
MKKTLCLLMALIMAVGLLAGCTNGTTANEVYDPDIKVGDTGGLKLPLTKEPMTLTWQVVSSETDIGDSWFMQKLRGVTGVDVQLNIMQASTVNEKLQALIAGGNIPDIIGSIPTDEQAIDLAMQGAFAPVEDYVDKLPNFKKTFVDNKDNNWIFDAFAAPDGKLYGYYGYDYNRDVNHTFMYRKDIFDKHGIKMWNSPEEFYQVLKKLKELYPSSTPYVSKVTDQIFSKWAPGWGIKAHETYFDEDEKVWKYTDTDPKYKEMLDFMKKLYNEGLIDPEFLTATQSAWTQKMTQADKAFVTFDWIDRMTMFKEQTLETVPSYDLRFANPVGPNQTYAEANQVCWARYVKKQDPKREEVAFKLLDFCLSPAGKELMTLGLEGETYTIGEDGMAKYIGFEETPSMTELIEKYGMFTEGMYLSFDRRSCYFNFKPQLKEAQEYMKDEKHVDPLDPELAFTEDETEKKNEYLATLQKSGKEFAVKYILGNASWDEWVNKAKSQGSEDLTKIYNDAYKRIAK